MPLSPLGDESSILSRRRVAAADLPAKIKFQPDLKRPIPSTLPSIQSNEFFEGQDQSGLRKNLSLDMREMVGGAVGNMSISPYSRDIVLAARRGLFIIDLEDNLKVPRFLPQGGTWDVADVQWNPHTSRAEYVVSTSCEKLLIWNLNATGNSNIEHILSSHYRAITDINWHTKEPDIVSSTGIDSWIWTWDLRETRKPIFGLCAFNAPGTQVKWNRHDPNILASAHANEVLIWDRRKGSLPISKISAHASKIYGIDWSHHDSQEIVTCSLDKTIKVWDMLEAEPKTVINTSYPVWRARNLPFGRGVLSLAQRGETMLEMYSTEGPGGPIHEFEGHTDVVKEFVWRRGGHDGNDFQLITWSKDRSLRFWGVDPDVVHQVGSTPVKPRHYDPRRTISFRDPPHATKHSAHNLSAPIGHRSILAGVRANAPLHHQHQQQQTPPTPPVAKTTKMTRGSMKSASRKVDSLTWLESVKDEDRRRGSSSNPGSEENSADASRMSSRSREDEKQRSLSRGRIGLGMNLEEPKENLQDEITRVMKTLAPNRVKLERHELTAKKRYCTIGLHGPWGQSPTVKFVFMRITFTFPKDYPHDGPDSTPTVNVEPNPLISNNDRARIIRKLKALRESRRPCLEPCLRYLLFKDENVNEKPIHLDSESSDEEDDEDDEGKRRDKEETLLLLRTNKNLAEPRTTQGTFGPNGELVCFFNSPPRNIPRLLSATVPSTPPEQEKDSMYKSPTLATEAIRRLEAAAVDHPGLGLGNGHSGNGARRMDEQITRFMTNFLTFSQLRFRDGFPATPGQERFVSHQKTTVLVLSTISLAGGDRKVARGYVFDAYSIFREGRGGDADGDSREGEREEDCVVRLCKVNAGVAQKVGRYDHARVFLTLAALLSGRDSDNMKLWGLVKQIIHTLAEQKDVQMLAMVSMVVLQLIPPFEGSGLRSTPKLRQLSGTPFRSDYANDYFSLSKAGQGQRLRSTNSSATRDSPKSPAWPRLGSPPTPSSGSSRGGSWSSLFTTNTMRQFMADKLTGVQDSFKDGLMTPSPAGEKTPPATRSSAIPIPGGGAGRREPPPLSPNPLASALPRKDSTVLSRKNSAVSWKEKDSSSRRDRDSMSVVSRKDSAVSRSWNEEKERERKSSAVSFSPAKSIVSTATATSHQGTCPKLRVVFEDAPGVSDSTTSKSMALPFDHGDVQLYLRYVDEYAEVLFRWEMYHKRLELLKVAGPHVVADDMQYEIGVSRICSTCNTVLPLDARACLACSHPSPMPNCSICRLPVKGLSQSCIRCLHVIHLFCKPKGVADLCPAGCGCVCKRK